MVRPRGAGPAPVAVSPTSPLVLAAEQARGHMGRTVPVPLTAAAGTVDLAARQVPAWLYDGKPPGGTIRLSRGDQLDVTLRDGLPEPTRNRWHGLALRRTWTARRASTRTHRRRRPSATASSYRPRHLLLSPTHRAAAAHGSRRSAGREGPIRAAGANVEAVLLRDDCTMGVGRDPKAVYADLRANGTSGPGRLGAGVDSA